ncbi:MAG: hypothetical protein D8M57_11015 [Candidatus Scalindua sp. AMX11]|nr:MAG: hypothetical protein DWQ00_16040 [Candidatus Scalindua sp.]TDE64846.1 MAG: hypothetical protein D8M57_11015 [Candidatus Scalindua sp. AMX11]
MSSLFIQYSMFVKCCSFIGFCCLVSTLPTFQHMLAGERFSGGGSNDILDSKKVIKQRHRGTKKL